MNSSRIDKIIKEEIDKISGGCCERCKGGFSSIKRYNEEDAKAKRECEEYVEQEYPYLGKEDHDEAVYHCARRNVCRLMEKEGWLKQREENNNYNSLGNYSNSCNDDCRGDKLKIFNDNLVRCGDDINCRNKAGDEYSKAVRECENKCGITGRIPNGGCCEYCKGGDFNPLDDKYRPWSPNARAFPEKPYAELTQAEQSDFDDHYNQYFDKGMALCQLDCKAEAKRMYDDQKRKLAEAKKVYEESKNKCETACWEGIVEYDPYTEYIGDGRRVKRRRAPGNARRRR
jgi:hypothetical protein